MACQGSTIQLWRFYDKLLSETLTGPRQRFLEIASGSGHLSLGLIGDSTFDSIILSDISPRFMRLLKDKVARAFPASTKKLSYCLFDANYLPFEASQFDVVGGNSVLHHFLNFEETLKSAYRVLRTGGVAVFGEPCMDSHVFTSMAARLIAECCRRNDNHPLSQYDLMIMDAVSQIAGQKLRNLNGPRDHLLSVEDKFVFPSHEMHLLSKNVGFRSFECFSPKVVGFSQVIKGQLRQFFIQQKIDLAKLDHFDYLFESIGSTYEAGMAGSLKMPFSLFLFIK